jgi:hypothetical protein
MAKSATAGEMRTRILIKGAADNAAEQDTDAEGYRPILETNLFDGYVYCKWVGAHGSDVYENKRLALEASATLTLRYTPKINQRCRVWRAGDPQDDQHAWTIISIDDPDDRHAYLELKIARKEPA